MSALAGDNFLGSVRRTEVLETIALLEETYSGEIARVIRAPLISVQRIVDALERDGIIVTQAIGVERRITFNPRFYAVPELKSLLLRLSDENAPLQSAVTALLRRPRRKGKPI